MDFQLNSRDDAFVGHQIRRTLNMDSTTSMATMKRHKYDDYIDDVQTRRPYITALILKICETKFRRLNSFLSRH